MKQAVYYTQGTCSQQINLTLNDDDTIEHVEFVGGCPGNTFAVSRLVKGMKVDDVIARLEGIRCGYKATSCPDQLARALRQMLATQQ